MITSKQHIKSPRAAYLGYLFQSFLKRPFGYIIALLYVVYLALILLIVPSAMHFQPLFIWTIGGFNMPMFNLFFIAASAASIAVAVFRVSVDDGTELSIASKPLTKNTTVLMKTLAYLLIMLIICVLTLLIAALVYPVFGEYNEVTNITGIEYAKYQSLVLSVFVGNIVNMLLFGGIAVFIAMVGGQVIIMIGTIGMVFLLFLMNSLFPQISKSATQILSDKYDTEILGYSCNTLSQYENPEDGTTPYNFAAIQCMTNESGEEGYHFDTKEYWEKALSESGRLAFNYIDIGKQLSGLYSSFGLDDSRVKEASKLVIGSNNSFNYWIDGKTHVDDPINIDNHNYPISIYGLSASQGKTYPTVLLVGGDMTIDTSNWYLLSTLFKLDFHTTCYVSTSYDSPMVTDEIREMFGRPWFKMSDLVFTTQDEKDKSEEIMNRAFEIFAANDHNKFPDWARQAIVEKTPGFEDLSYAEQFKVVAQHQLYWSILGQEIQNQMILDSTEATDAKFPFTSQIVLDWITHLSPEDGIWNDFITRIYSHGIRITPHVEGKTDTFCRLVRSSMEYAETYANLYQYQVSNFYSINLITTIWSIIAGVLFTGAIIVYKRTDIK